MSRILTMMILALGITHPTLAGTNLLQNPGFESGDLSNWQVEGQAASGVSQDGTPLSQAYFQPAQVVSHSGDYAAFNLTASFKRIGSTFSQDLTVLPNTSYETGFWMLHGHLTQPVKISPGILINGRPIGSLTITGGKGYGTSSADYQLIRGEFVTGCEQRAVRISFVLNAGGLMPAGMSYDDFFVRCTQPVIAVSPTSGTCGTPVRLSGWNFQPGEQVRLEPGSASVIATDENGAFSTTLIIPTPTLPEVLPPVSGGQSTTYPLPAVDSTLTITATGITTGRVSRTTFNIIHRGDYGDAPNSSLYPMNTGYFCRPDDFTSPLFLQYQAHFPAVSHVVSDCWLGRTVSLEAGEYDLQYDEDGRPNIEPYKGRADQDNDDGLILPVDLLPGATNTIQFSVSVAADAPAGPRYVNILFDWNQDGRWSGDEWAVRNQVVEAMPGECRVITSTPFPAGTNTGGCWMRLTLTTEAISQPTWDGSGDFAGGETEDWLLNIAPKPDLWVRLSAPEEVRVGEVFIMHLEYGNRGTGLASGCEIIGGNIPPGLTCLSDTGTGSLWDIGRLYPGDEGMREVSLRVEPWAAGELLLSSSIRSTQVEVKPEDNMGVWRMRVVSHVGNGAICGRVVDHQGLPIAAALVKASEASAVTGMAVTGPDGCYRITNLPDGTYTVAAEREGFTTRCSSGQVRISNGSQQTEVDIPLMPFSSKGMIAFCRGHNLWLLENGQERQLTDTPEDDTAPCISPDGRSIVFIRGSRAGGDVWLMSTDGRNQRRLTTTGNAGCPSFFPDGCRIVFSCPDGLRILDTDTMQCQDILPGQAGYPVISPDGAQVIFCRDGDIYLADTSGGSSHPLTHGTAVDYAPAFSPDGSMITFTRQEDSGQTGIWLMMRDGSGQRELVIDGFMARFSPDGRQLVFVSAKDGRHSLYTVEPGAEKRQRLTDCPTVDTYPFWGNVPPQEMVCVWPGDTNNDGMVSESDIFPIAVHLGETGQPRSGSMIWKPQLSTPWDRPDAAYADTDGDGRITVSDVLAIGMNWSLSHPVINGMRAPQLHLEEINHADYTRVYQAMYAILADRPQTYSLVQLKQALQGFITSGNNHETTPLPEQSILMQVYPNPYQPTSIHSLLSGIKFENLGTDWSIKVYNLAGELADELHGSGNDYTWTTARDLASGVYIYVVNSSTLSKKTGKLAIVR